MVKFSGKNMRPRPHYFRSEGIWWLNKTGTKGYWKFRMANVSSLRNTAEGEVAVTFRHAKATKIALHVGKSCKDRYIT